MNTILRLCMALLVGLSAVVSCRAADEGVPEAMAQLRKAEIANLVYDLRFDIPADTSEAVSGKIGIRFDFDKGRGAEFLPLDFSPSADKVAEVTVNGRPCSPRIADGHIYIPAAMLRAKGNDIELAFTPDDRHLNRRPDYMYTLFVPAHAHSVFPCFDQPDLKASFILSLAIPDGWECVGNSRAVSSTPLAGGRRLVAFAPTEPLSTYLFAFAAGDFRKTTKTVDGREISAYYRETDPARIAQLDGVIAEVGAALAWLEEFTGVKYPFSKYDFVVLPGFQFGGMEHTGATFYNDRRIFLNANPTPEQLLGRSQLIAHETAHMWFGDYVTMAWFNDVWTKEVFANYFAAAITREALPQFDHDIEWLRTYVVAALSEDRSPGRTSIRQSLDNLSNAGLIYNNIIYNKAPVMMAKLVELVSPDAFRKGIRRYVERYGYGNATWGQLIECLQEFSPERVEEFSHVWVNEKGMPEIRSEVSDGRLVVTQSDPLGRGLRWPQRFTVDVLAGPARCSIPVKMTSESDEASFPLPADLLQAMAEGHEPLIVPDSDGKGYGLFTLDADMLGRLLEAVSDSGRIDLSPSGPLAAWLNLNENRLAKRIPDRQWRIALTKELARATEPLRASALAGYAGALLPDLSGDDRSMFETDLMGLVATHPLPSTRATLLRRLASLASVPAVCDSLYSIWERQTMPGLDVNDYMELAWELALRRPDSAASILAAQRARLDNPDRLARFDYVSRAVSPDKAGRDEFFRYLLTPKGREIEPWAATALAYLNHPLRQQEAVGYIVPALEQLENVQRTGDIFFPASWCMSLLGNHRSPEARVELDRFLASRPQLNPLLRNKILNGAYYLLRATD